MISKPRPLHAFTLAALVAGTVLAACAGPEPAEEAPAQPAAEPSAAEAAAVPGTDSAYLEEIEAWRADRMARLTAEDGWLTLAGLYWLEEGGQTIGSAEGSGVPLPGSAPAKLGTLEKTGTAVLLRIAPGVDVTITPEEAARALPTDAGRTRSLVLVNDLDGEPTPTQRMANFYEKGDKPLEIVATRQWYIKNGGKDAALRKEMLVRGEEITWIPAHMKHRYDNWVGGLNGDWLISRQRFFGIPFPVWYPLDDEGEPDYEHPLLPREDELPVDPSSQAPHGYDVFQKKQDGCVKVVLTP